MINSHPGGMKDRATLLRYAGSHPADPLRGLRTLYAPIIEAPMPEAFCALLDRIDDATHAAKPRTPWRRAD